MENRHYSGRSFIEGFDPKPFQPSIIREGAKVPRHAELVSASQETLKRVQGDESVSVSHCRDSNPDLRRYRHCGQTECDPQSHSFSIKKPPLPSFTKGGRKAAFTLVEVFHPAGKSRRIAFTLAEVLITLGIIGVVAALTMPALIAHHKKTEIATSVKKFYSTVSQAILMSEVDNGPSKDWEKSPMVRDEDNNIVPEGQREQELIYFNKYLAKYIKYVKIEENPEELQNDDGQSNQIKIYLADGTYFFFNNGVCAHLTYDANGNKKPNLDGKDRFGFLICPADHASVYLGAGKNNFGPYCGGSVCSTRDIAKTKCTQDGLFCASLLMMDGWEFKSDYPYKL